MSILFSLLWMVLAGLVIGALARFILPGRDPMGWGATALLGILGSILGGLIGRFLFGAPRSGELLNKNIFLSLIGAILLLWLWRSYRAKA